MAYVTKKKDPSARLDYRWPWDEDENGVVGKGWLQGADYLTSVTFTVLDEDRNEIDPLKDAHPVEVDEYSFTPTDATAWLIGGTVDNVYLVVCHVISAEGREDDWTLKVRVVEK
jgi:hypothetical protein